MLIFEVENTEKVDTGKLGALAQFLSGIADDNNSKNNNCSASMFMLLLLQYIPILKLHLQ